jgi:hypothetical protein
MFIIIQFSYFGSDLYCFMDKQQTEDIIQILRSKGVEFDSGLTDEEIFNIELTFDIKFPPDYDLLIQTALPISKGFVNWREGLNSIETKSQIFSRLAWPLDGLLFDLQSDDFWVDEWGNMPDTYQEKELIAKRHYASYPKLIPIYSHRYIPSDPYENGNPVFSVYQMDIIYYGYDLATYFANEFNFALPSNFNIPDKPVREIEFWSNWVETMD